MGGGLAVLLGDGVVLQLTGPVMNQLLLVIVVLAVVYSPPLIRYTTSLVSPVIS